MSVDLEAYLEKLECPICQDIMVDACETSCGHSFCEYCIDSCLEAKANICPVCKKDPSPVHPSFTLRSICDSVRGFRSSSPSGQDSASPSASSTSPAAVEITSDEEKQSGNEKYGNGKFAEAIQHYSRALAKSPNGDSRNAVLYNNRAQCYIKIEQYRRALDDCEEAIRLDNKDVKAFMRKGLCLYRLGNFIKSRDAYDEARRLDTQGKWRPAIEEALASLPVAYRTQQVPASQFYGQQPHAAYPQYPYAGQQPQPQAATGSRYSAPGPSPARGGYPGQQYPPYQYATAQTQQQPYPPYGGPPTAAPAPGSVPSAAAPSSAAAPTATTTTSSSSSSSSRRNRNNGHPNDNCTVQ